MIKYLALGRGGEEVTLRSAKPTCRGSIPLHASSPRSFLGECPGGGIGIRARLKIVSRKGCGIVAHPGHMTTLFLTILWGIVLVYWFRTSPQTKVDVRKVYLPFRLFNVRNVSILMIVLQLIPSQYSWVLQKNDLSITGIVIGMVLCVTGLFLAVWSKKSLGNNWSGTPSVKDNHELIIKGPYKFIRHPLYTGLIITFLGSAIIGIYLWIFILILFLLKFSLKIRIEERLMTEQFPQDYLSYKKHTKMLVPFII